MMKIVIFTIYCGFAGDKDMKIFQKGYKGHAICDIVDKVEA